MNAVALRVNSFSASVYVVIVGDEVMLGDDDGRWSSWARIFWEPAPKFHFSNRLSGKDSTGESPSDSNSGVSFEANPGCAPISSSCSCFFHIASLLSVFTPGGAAGLQLLTLRSIRSNITRQRIFPLHPSPLERSVR